MSAAMPSSHPGSTSRPSHKSGRRHAAGVAVVTTLGLLSSPLLSAPSSAATLASDGGTVTGQLVTDAFTRTLAATLGQADAGGAWTSTGTGIAYSVAGGSGHLLLTTPGRDGTAYLPDALSTDTDLRATVAFPRRATGGGSYLSVLGRRVAGQGDYRLKFRHWSNDRVTVSLVRVVDGTETALTLAQILTESYVPGTPVHVAIRVRGTGPTSIFANAWTGSTEPTGWMLTSTDSSPALQTTGSPGFLGYLSSSATGSEEVTVDDVSESTPVTRIVTASTGSALNARPASSGAVASSFAFTSNLVGSRFQCRVDDASWSACTSPASFPGLADGRHTLTVQAVDSDGFAATPASQSWSIDTTAPALTVSGGPTAGSSTQATGASFSLSTNEPSTVECQLDGGAWAPCSSAGAGWQSLRDGQHDAAFRATDAAGNVSDPVHRTWTVDTTAPDTSVSAAATTDATATRNRMVLTATSTEPGTTECKLDAAAWSACSSPLTLSDLATGSHTFAVRATDRAGNTDATPATTSWTTTAADTTPPTTTLAASGPAQGTRVTSHSSSFGYGSSETGTFQCKLDTAAWSSCPNGSTTLSDLAYGVHTFSVRAVDTAGNTDPTPQSRVWTVVSDAAGTVRPDATNTGVPAGAVLKDYWGNLTISTPGAVVEGLDVHGFVRITAPGVTFRRSLVRGGDAGTTQTALVQSTGANVTLEDLELSPAFPSVNTDGLKGYGFTARRINSHDVVDTAMIYGDNSSITNSWLHDNRHYLVDPHQNYGPSHDDGLQIEGGTNLTVAGNRIPGGYNSAIQITQNAALTRSLHITDNWLGGGGCTVNADEKGKGAFSDLVISRNRFDSTSRLSCPMILPKSSPVVVSADVWDSSSTLISPRWN